MPRRWRGTPEHGGQVMDDQAKFNPAALRAVKALARSKPFQGTDEEKFIKFGQCLKALAEAYGIPCPSLIFPHPMDCYNPLANAIFLSKFSVVSFLHEVAHARGMDEWSACKFSLNLFKRCFPRSFAGCRFEGHMLVRRRGGDVSPDDLGQNV